MPAFITNTVHIQRYADAVFGVAIGTSTMAQVNQDITTLGGIDKALNAYFAGSAQTNATVAANLVKNVGIVVGGTVTAADVTVATNYVLGQLNSNKGNEGVTIKNILNLVGNLTADPIYGAAAVKFNADVDLALSYTGSSDTAAGTVVAPPFVMLTTADNIVGGSGNDTITAIIGTGATLNAGDAVNGGQGTDTLRLSYGSNVSLATALSSGTISSIETLSLINPGVADGSVTASGLTGLTTLRIEDAAALNSTNAATSIATPLGGVNLALATAGGVTTAGPVIWTANAADTTLNLLLNGYVSTATAIATNLTTTGAATTTLNVESSTAANRVATFLAPATVTTLNIKAATALTDTATTAVAATKVNITGAGNVTLGTTDFAATINIDASGSTGNIVLATEITTSLTYKGSAGNDTISFAAGELTSADSIDLGAGNNTLSIADTGLGGSGTAALNTVVNGITTAQTILITGSTTVDMSGVTARILSLGTGNNVVSKLEAADKLVVNGLTSGTLNATAALGFNTLNLELNGTTTAVASTGTLNATNQATVNILTTGGSTSFGTNLIGVTTNSANATFTVTGANALTITSLSSAASFDASAATGAINVKGADGASILKGGTKGDTLTGGTLAGGDNIDGGAGNDIIATAAITGTATTVITGGLGADAISLLGVTAVAKVFTINATAAQSYATTGQFDTVTIADSAAQAAGSTITLVTGILSSVLVGAATGSLVLGTTTITAGGFLAVGSVNATLTTTDQNFQIYQDSNSNGIIDANDLRVDFTDAATDTTAITLVGSQIVVVHTGV